MEILTEIITILVGGFTEFAAGFGAGITALVQGIFLTSGADGAQTLSTFGVLVIVFAAISLCVGLSRWVLNFVTSLGARNR